MLLLYSNARARFDAEYFHPVALKYEKIISSHNGKTLKELGCKVVSGPFGSSLKSDAYLPSGVPFVRISNLKDFFISERDLIYISEEDNKRLSSSQLKIGDLVLSKVGNTIGIVSKVTPEIGNCNISENNLGIRLSKDLSTFFKDYILTHLNSRIGQIQILRLISGNAQPKLNVSDVENLRVPIFSDDFSKLEDVIWHPQDQRPFFLQGLSVLELLYLAIRHRQNVLAVSTRDIEFNG